MDSIQREFDLPNFHNKYGFTLVNLFLYIKKESLLFSFYIYVSLKNKFISSNSISFYGLTK